MSEIQWDENKESIAQQVAESIEKETGDTIFTIKILEKEKDNQIDVLIVFESKAIMRAVITIDFAEGEMGVRVQGNYL